MAIHNITFTQVLKVRRDITIGVEADTPEEALALADEGHVDTPGYDHPGWTESAEIMDAWEDLA